MEEDGGVLELASKQRNAAFVERRLDFRLDFVCST